MLSILVVFILCYLIGSIPSSLWMGKIFYKVDIREHGSGNAGATNTFRILGWKAGTHCASFRFCGKGLLFCLLVISQLAYSIGDGPVSFYQGWDVDAMLLILSGMGAVIGHTFPLYATLQRRKRCRYSMRYVSMDIEPVSISISLGLFLNPDVQHPVCLRRTNFASLIYPFSQSGHPRYGLTFDIDGSIICI
ncbi:glycerol-3-phosphate acyltransferase [Rhodohalobacter sp.]|uniref:glycerol-3-phosphate acyltransferase n=1 Tax=Rhodohalobacter sp. TaxID=1974210 RepID=UPI002ACE8DB9|nr:glycerol-3-phosphate acyltransferase [Rhodohalobacter sp.]MDZ7758284.1 glycerol-3-phosphate acyltransferase [Rhodohalobacter sp.]